MGEPPIFTCSAQVFTIDPATKKTWKPSSTKSVDVNFFLDSTKKTYRIVSVEDLNGSKKIVLNCFITEKMVFKQTSQKFGQWADSRSGNVYGLGFNSEQELKKVRFNDINHSAYLKFVDKFRYTVEETRRMNEPLIIEKQVPLVSAAPKPNSNTNTLSQNAGQYIPVSASDDDSANSIAFRNVQAQIKKLEVDLANTRLQASKLVSSNGSDMTKYNASSEHSSGSWPILPPIAYNQTIIGQSTGYDDIDVSGSRKLNGTSLHRPSDSGVRNLDDVKKIREAIALQQRLGMILSDAVELNSEIGLILSQQLTFNSS